MRLKKTDKYLKNKRNKNKNKRKTISSRVKRNEIGRNEMIKVYSTPGLRVFAYNTDSGFIQLKNRGFLSSIANPAINEINKKLMEERPAFVSEDKIYPSCWLPPIPSPVFSRLICDEILISTGRFLPETVSFEVVRENNPNCKRDGPLPDPEFIKRVIDEAQNLGAVVITFTEGDPLLNEDVYEYIEYVDKTKSVVMCYTWGLNFSLEKAKKLKAAGLQTLLVSLYSTDPKEHDKIRGIPGAYDFAVNAIKYGLEAGLFVTVATHTNDENVDKLPELYEQAARLGAHEFSIWESVPGSDGIPKIGKESRNKIRNFYKKVNGRSVSENGNSNEKTQNCPRIFSNTVFESDTFGFLAGRRWLHIGIEGEVKPDPYIDLSYGCAKCTPLKTIWERMRKDPIFKKKRKNHPLQNKAYLKRVNSKNSKNSFKRKKNFKQSKKQLK